MIPTSPKRGGVFFYGLMAGTTGRPGREGRLFQQPLIDLLRKVPGILLLSHIDMRADTEGGPQGLGEVPGCFDIDLG